MTLRISPFDLFRLSWYELKRVAAGVRHSATVDITESCNLRCAHCYHFRAMDNIADDLPESVWRERFGELHRTGVRFVTLLGGEPALRKDVLTCADEIFPFIDVITNGTIKIPATFKHRLFVSIDGEPGTNDRIRGKGVFARIIDNYAGDRRVVIITTLNRQNYTQLEEIAEAARENKFSGVACGLYLPARGKDDPEKLEPEEREAIIEEIRRVRALYSRLVRMSDTMLEWYRKADHRDHCYVREGVRHFDVSMKRKKCFGDFDCSHCGCLAGASQSPLEKLLHPLETLKTLF